MSEGPADSLSAMRRRVKQLERVVRDLTCSGLDDVVCVVEALGAAGFGIWHWDIRSDQVYWSEGVESLFGLEPGTFEGTYEAYLALLSPEERQHTRQVVGEALESGDSYRIEHRLQTREGIRWLAARGKVFRSGAGEPVRMAGVVGDITERKHAESLLTESEARFRAFADASFEGIAFTAEGVVIDANERICEMFGYPPRGIVGMRVTDLLPQQDVELVRRHMAEGYEGAYEHRVIARDGRWIDVEARARSVIYRGRPARITALRDLTERNRLAAERRALEQGLLQAQKMEAVGRLAGGVAHDFNNLLTVILGNLELAAETVLPVEALQGIEEARDGAERAAALTAQLLAFSRREIPQPQRVSLNEVIADVRSMIRRLVREDVALSIHTEDDLPAVLIDPGQLQQVLVNLVINAQDAMPRGGSLEIRTSSRQYEVGSSELHPKAAGRYVLLSVSDSGLGMSEATRARIFEPFFTTKKTGRGTGLGLSMAQEIVQRARGSIAAESRPGKGTRIELLLPAQPEPAIPLYGEKRRAATRSGRETVLVCEDDVLVRTLISRILRSAGYDVLEASDGPSALAGAEQCRDLKLLVTDIIMPEMSGTELARRICGRHPTVRTLFCSGYAAGHLPDPAVLERPLEFLAKPFSRAALLGSVRRLLDQNQN